MIRSLFHQSRLCLLLLLCAGCAGLSKKGIIQKNYEAQLGIAYRNGFFEVMQKVIVGKYLYQIYRSEADRRGLLFETQWRDRPVFADEADLTIIFLSWLCSNQRNIFCTSSIIDLHSTQKTERSHKSK